MTFVFIALIVGASVATSIIVGKIARKREARRRAISGAFVASLVDEGTNAWIAACQRDSSAVAHLAGVRDDAAYFSANPTAIVFERTRFLRLVSEFTYAVEFFKERNLLTSEQATGILLPLSLVPDKAVEYMATLIDVAQSADHWSVE